MVIQPGGAPVGLVLVSDTSSASTAIPTLSNGARPKWVYVGFSSGSLGSAGIRFGTGTVSAATTSNTIGVGYQAPIVVNVAGNSAYTAISSTASVITVVPLAGVVPGG